MEGKIKTYFGRGFVAVINGKYKLAVCNDIYSDDGLLKELECVFKTKEELEQFKLLIGSIVNISIVGQETQKRKEKFSFQSKIIINNIICKYQITNEIIGILKVTELK
ncbi:MAG: hypothetical protein E6929_11685 [Clostridium sp.]|nr:hypothetical protein [Clostridium sp.]